jgi:hypothetical protein
VKFRLLLVDANIIIELFRLGVWEKFLLQCEVHLSKTVLKESHFYEDANDQRQPIDLEPFRVSGQITVHDVDASRLIVLRDKLGPTILEKMDAGEAELLCVLDDAPPNQSYRVCSADAVVYRYLGATTRTAQGISLEEILNAIGLTKKLEYQYRQTFREKYSQAGFQQGITGQALQP